MGAHYTPAPLARFVADKAIAYLEQSGSEFLRVLDPACGDGQLLKAAIEALLDHGIKNWQAVGVEADAQALGEARNRLTHPGGVVHLIQGDFLRVASEFTPQQELWSEQGASVGLGSRFDLVIANPPYVRTQVLGAAEAQRIASRYDLSGRVDLYHAFIRAIGDVLRSGGILGIITSNRFMTTLAGKAVRSYLATQLEVLEVIDLGDTRLFEAAVLPAVLIARRKRRGKQFKSYSVPFIRVYSHTGQAQKDQAPVRVSGGIVEALATGDEGIVDAPEGTFAITRGHFAVTPGATDVWRLVSSDESEFLKRIRERSSRLIEDVALVRVGIKTTADEVFIRKNWAALPCEECPESELLRPILSHEDARRWALPGRYVPAARVLYPHLVSGNGKRVINLFDYPCAERYLESFRSRLEARSYVVEAGRRWYEIWVPQDPAAWVSPKIVFPDISAEPKFFLVKEEYLVNGDCYWITLRPGAPEETLYLILGVANSELMTRFHDAAFSNKLYSARRRYITQYVAKYPLPTPDTPAALRISTLTRKLVEQTKQQSAIERLSQLEHDIDVAVYEAFGLERDGGV